MFNFWFGIRFFFFITITLPCLCCLNGIIDKESLDEDTSTTSAATSDSLETIGSVAIFVFSIFCKQTDVLSQNRLKTAFAVTKLEMTEEEINQHLTNCSSHSMRCGGISTANKIVL